MVAEDALCSEGRIEITFMSPCLPLDTIAVILGVGRPEVGKGLDTSPADTLKVKVRNLPLGCFVQN